MQRAACLRVRPPSSGRTNSRQCCMRSATGSYVAVVPLELEETGDLAHASNVTCSLLPRLHGPRLLHLGERAAVLDRHDLAELGQ